MAEVSALHEALETPQEHLVSPRAVNSMTAYILEKQIVTPKHQTGDLFWYCSLEEQITFDSRRGIKTAPIHGLRIVIKASQRAYEEMQTLFPGQEIAMQVPNCLQTIREENWQYIAEYYLPREP